ncbi:FkbM family methyltransferase [Congregibacter variabilis]|uniref:FkbM family methyltransferase n=1 Tax=Congregibacter variabilis TaxID=3081200 RepID=A0ABZ0I1S1_9GAMM|nr:FkbM family methyltransferase [Congregibacter sp. IMCC43200]
MRSYAAKWYRTLASYFPSKSLLTARRLKDSPLRCFGLPHESDFLPLKELRGQDLLIVDVGANRGQSIDSFTSVLGDARITSIEPNPILAQALRKHYPTIDIHNLALGAKPDALTLHVPRYGYTYWDTRASLDNDFASSFLGPHNFMFFREERAGLESFDVPVGTLDELALAPDILKIDAEGYEYEILLGGHQTLSGAPIVIIEKPGPDIIKYMEKYGFDPYSAVGSKLIQRTGKLNTIFLHPAKHRKFIATVLVEL